MEEQEYYQYQKRWERPFAFLSSAARRKMMDIFLDRLNPNGRTRILDVGVTTDMRPDSNFFERHYPFPDRITCAGLDGGGEILRAFPQVRYVRIGPQSLPFRDRAFDIGTSFAVVEHVGERAHQRHHIAELLRVCRRVFVTTPNRAFPIEPHTMLPLIHYLPDAAWRKSLTCLGRGFYASSKRLNPLDRLQLRTLFPENAEVKIEKVGLLGLTTNLIAVANGAKPARRRLP